MALTPNDSHCQIHVSICPDSCKDQKMCNVNCVCEQAPSVNWMSLKILTPAALSPDSLFVLFVQRVPCTKSKPGASAPASRNNTRVQQWLHCVTANLPRCSDTCCAKYPSIKEMHVMVLAKRRQHWELCSRQGTWVPQQRKRTLFAKVRWQFAAQHQNNMPFCFTTIISAVILQNVWSFSVLCSKVFNSSLRHRMERVAVNLHLKSSSVLSLCT